MRKKLIAGNWKMNLGYKDSEELANNIVEKINKKLLTNADVLICPSFISLGIVSDIIRNTGIKLGAQNLHYENDGAFTGEISASMLKSVGCEYVIVGHSERRKYFHESDKVINRKIKKALEFELRPIVCVGESFQEREDEIFEGIVEKQVTEDLSGIETGLLSKVVIAYEPVWAIGTGMNATPAQISDMHIFIRKVISKLYNDEQSDLIRILYGGSVSDKNANEILFSKGVDGALIGGVSLKAEEFVNIVKLASTIK